MCYICYNCIDSRCLIKKNVYNLSGNKLLYRVETHQGKLDNIHNEVILMIDASTSNGANWNKIKSMLVGIGEELLDGTGRYQITLMGFGFSDKLVVKGIKSVEELNEVLLDPDLEFLYGRSASNCEAAVAGVYDYLNSIDDLNEATVIYVSDSASNMSDEPIDWENYYKEENKSWRFNSMSVKILASMVWDVELQRIMLEGNETPATRDVFGIKYENLVKEYLVKDDVEAMIVTLNDELSELDSQKATATESQLVTLEEEIHLVKNDIAALNEIKELFVDGSYTGSYNEKYANAIGRVLIKTELYNEVTDKLYADDDIWVEWANRLWKDAYEEAGLTYGESVKYPISKIEKVFVDYDAKHQYNVQDIFYYNIFGYTRPNKFIDASDKGLRASAAVEKLAEKDNVKKIYMIGYGNSAVNSWMNPDSGHKNAIESEKVEYLHLNSVNDSLEISKPIVDNVEYTGYHDMSITEYVSKWGILQPNTIKIYDGDKVIYEYSEETQSFEWTISEEERPVTSQIPIEVTVLEKDEYDVGGANTIGNTSGDIYKIYWKVKDGELFKTDHYHIEYEVLLDTEEEGFEYNVEYPTNGDSVVDYMFNDVVVEEVIEVPSMLGVKVETLLSNPITFDYVLYGILIIIITFYTLWIVIMMLNKYDTVYVSKK